MSALSAELSAIAGAAFAAEGLSQAFGQVTRSDRPDLAQFQCNGALAAAAQRATAKSKAKLRFMTLITVSSPPRIAANVRA